MIQQSQMHGYIESKLLGSASACGTIIAGQPLLQKVMKLSRDECHIGMFNAEQCERLLRLIETLRPRMREVKR